MSAWTAPTADRAGRRLPPPVPAAAPSEWPPGGTPTERGPAGRDADPPRHLPPGAHVGDRRGLTGVGAVTLALSLGLLGAAVDVGTGPGLRTVFDVCFIAGCALAALLVHREDLRLAITLPPLAYCVLALAGGALGSSPRTGSLVRQESLELVSALVLGAPILFAATGAAVVVAAVRVIRGRSRPR